MRSIWKTISSLRDRILIPDRNNSNRYRVLSKEADGTHTAYCFSTPIYNKDSRNLVQLYFEPQGAGFRYVGSLASVTVCKDIVLNDGKNTLMLQCSHSTFLAGKGGLFNSEGVVVLPTLNGVLLKLSCLCGVRAAITVKVDSPFMNVRRNSKCFSFMREEFLPFASLSVIGAFSKGCMLAPARVDAEIVDAYRANLIYNTDAVSADEIWVEVNLHEPKLFHDTTVESGHPGENNAFGTAAFLGQTNAFGEQWLYSRLDFSLVSDLFHFHEVRSADVFFSVYKKGKASVATYGVSARFCSFGSTWDSRVAETEYLSSLKNKKGFLTRNVTDRLKANPIADSLIMRCPGEQGEFTAIATGDSCWAPPLLVVRYL